MAFKLPYKYITGEDLSELIKSDKLPHKDYIVVDVRDNDYPGGNIKNCLNVPSHEFEDEDESGGVEKVKELVQRTSNVPVVIFHCALSQQRGPKSARIYAETRAKLHKEGTDEPYEVFVLRGGFSEFQLKYKDDPLLVENWDKRMWTGRYY